MTKTYLLYPNFTTFIFLWVLGLLLLSCSPSLNEQNSHLQAKLDSLQFTELALQRTLTKYGVYKDVYVEANEGLFQTLSRTGLENLDIINIINAIKDSVELFKLKVDDQFVVGFPAQDSSKPNFFRYKEHAALYHQALLNQDKQWEYQRIEKPTTINYRVHTGSLEAGSTLDGMLRAAEISSRMVQVVNGVLMCKIPFRTHAQPGDTFKVLLEERWFQDSIWISGKVLFAEYGGRVAGHHQAFLYEDEDPKSTFNAHYTRDGEALVYSGLRYPLDRMHITSGFGRRLHPVTGVRRLHNGVDYSARVGTPVYAVAEGVVTVSGYDNLSGNKIAIRHKDNSSSWYLHLHRRSVRNGQRVQARQVIGTTGASGRVTGPHLHFGFKDERGRWINPELKRMIATPKLQGERLEKLKSQIQSINDILNKAESIDT
ncbi:MAG: M23 family metallopeptidase [Fibrobacter sp.]|nr:M23 family metallopeptidase [Fibrobacter sp.]